MIAHCPLRCIALRLAVLSLCAVSLWSETSATPELPDLGETHAANLSPERAYRTGRAWLRVFRSRAPIDDDPLLYDYLHQMIQRLAKHSELQDRRLEIVIVDSPSLNAFAVPGGIIGVNNGLLLYAQDEEELAAVLGHEIGHLQQKHYARNVEQAQRRALPTIAGLLASILLIASGDPEAGAALLYSTQAAGIESQLRYSRRYELEADRVGVKILAQAGMSPLAVPEMFGRMLHTYRFRTRPPEFLLTHPVTERRVAESRALAAQYIKNARQSPAELRQRLQKRDDDYFALMKARVELHFAPNPGKAVQTFADRLRKNPQNRSARYGYALALRKDKRPQEATAALAPLLGQPGVGIPAACAAAEIFTDQGQYTQALQMLRKQLRLHPGHYALSLVQAQTLLASGDTGAATLSLEKQLARNPAQPYPWLLLAESAGLSGDISGVHRSNAEYLALHGRFDEAVQRLRYALRLSDDSFQESSLLRQRILEIQQLKKEHRQLL